MKKWLCLVLAGMLLLCCTACDGEPASSVYAGADISATTTTDKDANTKTHLETNPKESVRYNEAIIAYNAFLLGETAVKTDDGQTHTVLQYGLNDEGISAYALSDINKDNVPELFIHGHLFHIIAFDGTQLVEWYQSQNGQRIYLLDNGAVWHIRSSTADFYRYVSFDGDGIIEDVSFSQPFEGDPSSTYFFWGCDISGEVSKEDWDILTKPYFEQAEKTVELNWVEWK